MRLSYKIRWPELASGADHLIREDTRSKYFPKNPLRQEIIDRFLRNVSDILAGLEWRELLDVGCGEGFVDYYLGRRFENRNITGLELDPEAVEAASLINPDNGYVRGDGRALPFSDDSFDAAICLEVLEHLDSYPEVMADIRRVSRGPCLISVPAWPWYQATNFMLGKNWARKGEHPGHVVQFSAAKLETEMRRHMGGSPRVRLAYPWLIGLIE